MTDTRKIPRHRDPVDDLVIEMLLEENEALRKSLADLGADHVLLRSTFVRLLRGLDDQNRKLREAREELALYREVA